MIWVVVAIMLGAGVLGGVLNSTLSAEPPSRRGWITSIVAGIGASLLIPLFLRTLSSNLLVTVLSPERTPESVLVLAGFCLVAAISSRSFIQTLSDRILSEAREANRRATMATQEVREVRAAAEVAGATSQAARDAVSYGLTPAAIAGKDEIPTFPEIEPGSAPDDPWFGQFGGSNVSNKRVLEARIFRPQASATSRTVALSVRSTEGSAAPLTGYVQFYLHPTFGNARPVVKVIDGVATLTVESYGAFTVGALADGGDTKLELDLSRHPEAEEPWRSS
jgi:hypothetical protein